MPNSHSTPIGSKETEHGIDLWVSAFAAGTTGATPTVMFTMHSAMRRVQTSLQLTTEEARAIGTFLLDGATQAELES